ncbi:MAG: acyl carrier protein, partial [Pirellulales bacterium]
IVAIAGNCYLSARKMSGPSFKPFGFTMNREHVRGRLKTIFEDETDHTLESLNDNAVLAEDFALDSVDLVSLLMRVESQFQVRLTNAELTESRTVGALIDLVSSKTSESSANAPRLCSAA